MTTKSSMLTEDTFAIEIISLVRGGHEGAQGFKFCLQIRPIKMGLARVVVTVRAEHLVREGAADKDPGRYQG